MSLCVLLGYQTAKQQDGQPFTDFTTESIMSLSKVMHPISCNTKLLRSLQHHKVTFSSAHRCNFQYHINAECNGRKQTRPQLAALNCPYSAATGEISQIPWYLQQKSGRWRCSPSRNRKEAFRVCGNGTKTEQCKVVHLFLITDILTCHCWLHSIHFSQIQGPFLYCTLVHQHGLHSNGTEPSLKLFIPGREAHRFIYPQLPW